MAAGSDLLDDVFFNKTEADKKVVSDQSSVGSPECELSASGRDIITARVQSAANYVGGSAVDNSNVQSSKMGLSQLELAKAGKIAPHSG